MNFIVGRIYECLQDEEATFWLLVKIVEIYLGIDYYSQFIGV